MGKIFFVETVGWIGKSVGLGGSVFFLHPISISSVTQSKPLNLQEVLVSFYFNNARVTYHRVLKIKGMIHGKLFCKV